MKGLIVCGYPGVGKSSIAGWRHNCIDLESSNFSQWFTGSDKAEWEQQYVTVATDLANQGYTVMVSTHPGVIDLLSHLEKIPVVIFCPKVEMKDQWNKRLMKRYEQTQDPKDQRAWRGAMANWEKNLERLFDYGLPVIQPAAIGYDLKNYIFHCWHKYCGM